MKNRIIISLFISGLLTVGCKQKYDPPAVTTNLDLLVVDGFLNNSADSTIIRLSRTKKNQEGVDRTGELNAQMFIEDAAGNTLYNFQEINGGNYAVAGLNLNENSKYRLRINTLDGRQYLSDEVIVKKTPPFDSISWQRQDNGVTIYANTHDPSGSTLYYRWDYTETYNYFSFYYSDIRYDNGVMYDRAFNELVYECWKSVNSTSLLLGTSAKLSSDIISQLPVRFIEENGIELGAKYSILLRQYALTKEAFDYYQNLKKISEQLGSIFDAQPSQVSGNIRCLNNPAEAVLGFISASTVSIQRIFIDKSQVQPWRYPFFCDDERVIGLDSVDYYFKKGSSQTPITTVRNPFTGQVIGYTGAQTGCVDCVSRGGTNVKPDFWP